MKMAEAQLRLCLLPAGPSLLGLEGFSGRKQKKSGLSMVTLNLHVQPRLPGSVVGETSMRYPLKSDKITEASVLK